MKNEHNLIADRSYTLLYKPEGFMGKVTVYVGYGEKNRGIWAYCDCQKDPLNDDNTLHMCEISEKIVIHYNRLHRL